MRAVATATREEWLEARKSRITASDAAAILGHSPFRSRLDVWAEKTGQAAPVEETERMRLGRLLEPAILKRYALDSDLTVAPNDQLHVHPTMDWLAATPDAFVRDGERTVGLVQAKATRSVADWVDGPPIQYQVQVAVEMAVADMPWDDVAVLISGADYECHRVERHADAEAAILAELHEFYQRFIVGGQTPPPATDADVKLWSKVVPQRPKTVVTLPTGAVQIYEAWRHADAAAKSFASEASDLKAKLLALQGDAEVGVLPGLGMAMKRSTVTVPEKVTAAYTFSKFTAAKWKETGR